jgi:hypothetical protein
VRVALVERAALIQRGVDQPRLLHVALVDLRQPALRQDPLEDQAADVDRAGGGGGAGGGL